MSDHIKATIVDGQTAFLGGMNIGREYRYDWHDMMFEVSGPIVQQLDNDFNNTWQPGIFGDRKGVREIDPSASTLPQMRLLYTRLHNVQIYKAQLAAIRAARQYIYVENAYFSDDSIRYELIRASLRGVDVRVILPERGNHGSMNKSNIMAVNSLLKYGVQVYTYPGMTHVKAMIADGWACFGSANMDKLSLKINKELNIATSDQGIVKALKEKLFEQDFRDSEILTSPLDTNWNYPFYELLADAVM